VSLMFGRSRRPVHRDRALSRGRWPVLALVGLAAGAWGLGLAWFAGELPAEPPAQLPRTDAVVVLTGGSRRIAAGLELLVRGEGRKLLISGVHPDVMKAEIASVDPRAVDLSECCVILDYQATDTIGNAQETARWMKQEGFNSLTLVTGTYHMPRSLAEFRRAMPGVRIVAYPVFPENFKREAWWRWPGSAALVIVEYHKYALARLRFGLADLVGTRDAAVAPGRST
jgi:uncharacterized SAM-binding protein YcdF (DUF218 family)